MTDDVNPGSVLAAMRELSVELRRLRADLGACRELVREMLSAAKKEAGRAGLGAVAKILAGVVGRR